VLPLQGVPNSAREVVRVHEPEALGVEGAGVEGAGGPGAGQGREGDGGLGGGRAGGRDGSHGSDGQGQGERAGGRHGGSVGREGAARRTRHDAGDVQVAGGRGACSISHVTGGTVWPGSPGRHGADPFGTRRTHIGEPVSPGAPHIRCSGARALPTTTCAGARKEAKGDVAE
jgi:hypothetical protein